MATPYPESFPTESITLMLSAVRGAEVKAPEIVHACWVVAGFGLKQVFGGGPVVMSEAEMTDEDILNLALEHDNSNANVSAAVIPWYAIVMLAIRLAKAYISL